MWLMSIWQLPLLFDLHFVRLRQKVAQNKRERRIQRERERDILWPSAWLLGCLPFASGYPCRFFQSHLMLQSALLSEPSATLHCLFQLLAVCKSYAPWPRPPTQPASQPACCMRHFAAFKYVYVWSRHTTDKPEISIKSVAENISNYFSNFSYTQREIYGIFLLACLIARSSLNNLNDMQGRG